MDQHFHGVLAFVLCTLLVCCLRCLVAKFTNSQRFVLRTAYETECEALLNRV